MIGRPGFSRRKPRRDGAEASGPRPPRERRERRAAPAIDAARLNDLALAYVARFATTEHKLRAYLGRKVRERGWTDAEGDGSEDDREAAKLRAEAAIAEVAARLTALRYVDDAGYAIARGASLERRGLGRRRIAQALTLDGVGAGDAAEPLDHAEAAARETALAYARRRRLGPWAREAVADPRKRQSQVAAFVRAGHAPGLAARIIALAPGTNAEDDPDQWEALLGAT